VIENLLISGGVAHDFGQSSATLAALLQEQNIRSTITTELESALAQLAGGKYALLTLNLLRWRMTNIDRYADQREQWAATLSAQAEAAIVAFLERGGSMLAMHCASICFDSWLQWRDILGASWSWEHSFHPPLGPANIRVMSDTHPIVAGLSDFVLDDEIYSRLILADDLAAPLLSAEPESGAATQPVLWTRRLGTGRIVYDALGHDSASMNHATHKTIIQRAAAWALDFSDAQVEAISCAI
jgi:type 1 glutamine amidotransferase